MILATSVGSTDISSQHFNPYFPDEHLELRRCVMEFNLYERSAESANRSTATQQVMLSMLLPRTSGFALALAA